MSFVCLVCLVRSLVGLVKSLVGLVKSLVGLVKSLVGRVKSLVCLCLSCQSCLSCLSGSVKLRLGRRKYCLQPPGHGFRLRQTTSGSPKVSLTATWTRN